ncbi:amino acid ABC transporter substrate-binding protein [Candidatus Pacearchaeota archaeon]|nr:amino acid ABC transporter substrate-binding protein [Candidatus Pacearchaeota archaeon]
MEIKTSDNQKNLKKGLLIIAIVIFIVISLVLISYNLFSNKEAKLDQNQETESQEIKDIKLETNKIIIASGEWSPYVSENLLQEGVVSRIVRESFELKGFEVEYVYLPWARSMEEAKIGKYHGTFPWIKTTEREESFYYSVPIAYQKNVFFHRKDTDFNWATLQDLKNLTIGANSDYSYGEEVTQEINNGTLTVEYIVDDKANIKKLLAKRVDIVIADLDATSAIIKKLTEQEQEQITYHPRDITQDPLYLLLTKSITENKETMEIFNSGFKRLQESGKIEQYWNESRNGEYTQK